MYWQCLIRYKELRLFQLIFYTNSNMLIGFYWVIFLFMILPLSFKPFFSPDILLSKHPGNPFEKTPQILPICFPVFFRTCTFKFDSSKNNFHVYPTRLSGLFNL